MVAPLPSLLFVEDDSFQATFFQRSLEKVPANFGLHHAFDGVDALEQLADAARELPDLIVLDVNMPRLGGLETLERIRNDKRLEHLPVFMFSTSEQPREISKAYQLGANGYLIKPRDSEEMQQAIQLFQCFLELNRIPHAQDLHSTSL